MTMQEYLFPENIEADENDATRLETTPSPNRQKDKGEQLRRKNRE